VLKQRSRACAKTCSTNRANSLLPGGECVSYPFPFWDGTSRTGPHADVSGFSPRSPDDSSVLSSRVPVTVSVTHWLQTDPFQNIRAVSRVPAASVPASRTAFVCCSVQVPSLHLHSHPLFSTLRSPTAIWNTRFRVL
jgi:hypothetical protein